MRTNVVITLNGETRTLAQWVRDVRGGDRRDYKKVLARLSKGWTQERALSTP